MITDPLGRTPKQCRFSRRCGMGQTPNGASTEASREIFPKPSSSMCMTLALEKLGSAIRPRVCLFIPLLSDTWYTIRHTRSPSRQITPEIGYLSLGTRPGVFWCHNSVVKLCGHVRHSKKMGDFTSRSDGADPGVKVLIEPPTSCLLYTAPSPRD